MDKATRKAINILLKRVDILVAGQMAIVEHLGEKSQGFRARFIATILSNDEFRESFTEFVNKDKDANDTVITQLIAINEAVRTIDNKDNKEEE